VAQRHGRPGCGARGRYDEQGKPVAREADAARLDGMYGRLIDAMALSPDPLRVRCLAERLAELRLMERDVMWVEIEADKLLWCREHGRFEEEMQWAECDLAREDFLDYTGSHLVCCGDNAAGARAPDPA